MPPKYKPRCTYTPTEKVAILRHHLLNLNPGIEPEHGTTQHET